MTVSTTDSRRKLLGNGVSTAFPFNLYFLEADDLVVFVGGILQTSGYTVTGAGNEAGGTVTFTSPPANGVEIIIIRDPDLKQLTDYAANDAFPAESHERALDKLTMIAQRLAEKLVRSLVLSDADGTSPTLTIPVNRANKALIFDAMGNVTVSTDNYVDQANAAAGFANEAASSAAAALASEQAAAAAFDSFDDRYLGPKLADPTVDNDGNPLLTGALYYNTSTMRMRVYGGMNWIDVGTAVPVSFTTELFSGNGSQTVFTLAQAPAYPDGLFVSISGIIQRPNVDFSVSGTTLTFLIAPPPAGTQNILVRNVTAVAAGVPNDGSVSTAKLQDRSVTNPKIALGAVSPDLLSTGAPTWDVFGLFSASRAFIYGDVTLGDAGTDTIELVGEVVVGGTPGTIEQVLQSQGPDTAAKWSNLHKSLITANTLTTNNAQTVAHGLGSRPVITGIALVFQSAQAGWAVGDEVFRWLDGVSGVADSSIGVGADATNVVVTSGSSSSVAIGHKTTGVSTAVPISAVKVRVYYSRN